MCVLWGHGFHSLPGLSSQNGTRGCRGKAETDFGGLFKSPYWGVGDVEEANVSCSVCSFDSLFLSIYDYLCVYITIYIEREKAVQFFMLVKFMMR